MTDSPFLVNIIDKTPFNLLLLDLIHSNEVSGKHITYCGIGSRSTPPYMLTYMRRIAKRLEHQWFVLYTGGAEGADTAFMAGTQYYKVFMPAHIHQQRTSNRQDLIDCTILPNWNEALQTVYKYHPNPYSLNDFGKKLMARNAYCVLGLDLNSPVDFILCWTPDGKEVGGTSQALRIAKDYDIPVFNLAFEDVFKSVISALKLAELEIR